MSDTASAVADASVSAAKDLLRLVGSQALALLATGEDVARLARRALARLADVPTRTDARHLAERVDDFHRAADQLLGDDPGADRPA